MSRQIDFSKPLDEFEKQYLMDRNQGHLIPDDSQVEESVVEESGQDTDADGAPADDADSTDAESSEEDEVDGEYGAMKVEELKALLTARDLPTTGNKVELIARLESADQES